MGNNSASAIPVNLFRGLPPQTLRDVIESASTIFEGFLETSAKDPEFCSLFVIITNRIALKFRLSFEDVDRVLKNSYGQTEQYCQYMITSINIANEDVIDMLDWGFVPARVKVIV